MTEALPAQTPAKTFARRTVIPLLLCLTFGVAGTAVINDTIYYNPDSAHYLDWARSIARGMGFRLLSYPEPRRYVSNAPLYPIILAPAEAVFPASIPAAKAVTLGFGILSLFLFYRCILRYTRTSIAAGIAMLLLFNPFMILYSTQVLSDIPFAAAILVWCALMQRIADGASGRLTFPFLIAATSACILLRDVGLVFLVGAALWMIARRELPRALMIGAVCLLVYLLWIVRNDILVGGTEHPANSNSTLLLSHYLTAGSGIGSELLARLRSNGWFYGSLAGTLLFVTQSVGTLYDVVRPQALLLHTVRQLASNLYLPVAAITFGTSAAGGVLFWKKHPSVRALIVVPVLYVAIILVYPVTDVRFLFPLLLLELFLSAYALHELLTTLVNRSASVRYTLLPATVILILLLSVPNLLWTANFVETSLLYKRLPEGLTASAEEGADYPTEFAKPFHAAMEWVDARTDSTATIASHDAEAGLWGQGRKVIDVSPLMSPETFEAVLRDYQVPYLLSVSDPYSAGEYAILLPAVDHFRFVPEFQAGDISVLRVIPVPHGQPPGAELKEHPPDSILVGNPQTRTADQYTSAVELMYQGRPSEAEGIFEHLRGNEHIAMPATFCAGIAAGLASRFDEAKTFFQQLGGFPQSAAYMKQAQYHLEILDRLQAAESTKSIAEKITDYQSASIAYWELGFHDRALQILQTSMKLSPDFFPSYVFASVFELQRGDTNSARAYAERAKSLDPGQPLSRSLHTVFRELDSLRNFPSPGTEPDRRREIALQYISLGLTNMAITELLDILRIKPDDVKALRILTDLYIAKQCYAPALRVVTRLVAAEPENEWGKTEILRLAGMWE